MQQRDHLLAGRRSGLPLRLIVGPKGGAVPGDPGVRCLLDEAQQGIAVLTEYEAPEFEIQGPAKLGIAKLNIDIGTKESLEVAKKMEGVQGISAADAITGEYDVIAVCEAPDVNSIGSLIVDKIQKIDGVFKTITCLAVK